MKIILNNRAATMYDLEDRVNFAVFPALQGGPHNNIIAGVAVCLREAMSPAFRAYQEQVVRNAKHFAQHMVKKGYALATGVRSVVYLVEIGLSWGGGGIHAIILWLFKETSSCMVSYVKNSTTYYCFTI
jgi:glycine/serine hydroxymethyltransferase